MRTLSNQLPGGNITIYTGAVEPGLNLNLIEPDDNNSNPIMNVDQTMTNITSINNSLLPPIPGVIAIVSDISNAIANIEFPSEIDLTKETQFATFPSGAITLGNIASPININGANIIIGNIEVQVQSMQLGEKFALLSDITTAIANIEFPPIPEQIDTADSINFGTNLQSGIRTLGQIYNQTIIIGDYIKIGNIDVPQNFTQGSSQTFALVSNIPNSTSELTNDSNFITIDDVPTKTSELTNDSNFITINDVPTKTSELTNDSNFITIDDVPSGGGSGTGFTINGTTATAPPNMSEYIFSSGSGSSDKSCIMTIKSDTDNTSDETANCQLLFSKEQDLVQGYIGMGIPGSVDLQNQLVLECIYDEPGAGYVNIRSQGTLRARFGGDSTIYTDLEIDGSLNSHTLPSGSGGTYALLSDIVNIGGGISVTGDFTNKTATLPLANNYIFNSGVNSNGSCILTIKSDNDNPAAGPESKNCEILFSKEDDAVQGSISMGIPGDGGDTNNDMIIDCKYDSTLRIRTQGTDRATFSSTKHTIGDTETDITIQGQDCNFLTNNLVCGLFQANQTITGNTTLTMNIGSQMQYKVGFNRAQFTTSDYPCLYISNHSYLYVEVASVLSGYFTYGGFFNQSAYSSTSNYTTNVIDKLKLLQIHNTTDNAIELDFDLLETHFPNVVDRHSTTDASGNNQETKGTQYHKLVPCLIKAIMEQQSTIESLETPHQGLINEISNLVSVVNDKQAEIDLLKLRLDHLESRFNTLTQ